MSPTPGLRRTPSADQLLKANIAAFTETAQMLAPLAHPLQRAADLLSKALLDGHKLLTCGNGGSACDAAHLATEFLVRFQDDRRPFPAIALSDSGSTLTAAGNDYGFEHIFARQIRGLGQPGDVLIAITTSGNSRNIILALEAAREAGVKTITLLGKGGGAAKGLADIELLVPSPITARVQEAHLLLYHTLCELVESSIAAK